MTPTARLCVGSYLSSTTAKLILIDCDGIECVGCGVQGVCCLNKSITSISNCSLPTYASSLFVVFLFPLSLLPNHLLSDLSNNPLTNWDLSVFKGFLQLTTLFVIVQYLPLKPDCCYPGPCPIAPSQFWSQECSTHSSHWHTCWKIHSYYHYYLNRHILTQWPDKQSIHRASPCYIFAAFLSQRFVCEFIFNVNNTNLSGTPLGRRFQTLAQALWRYTHQQPRNCLWH